MEHAFEQLLGMGAPERVAVDCNHIESIAFEIQAGHPGQECFLERVGANHAKDSADGIVGWNAVPELDELFEPRKPDLSKQLDKEPGTVPEFFQDFSRPSRFANTFVHVGIHAALARTRHRIPLIVNSLGPS